MPTRRPLEFGISVVPTADDLDRTRALVRAADRAAERQDARDATKAARERRRP